MHPFWASLIIFAVFITVEGVASWIFIRSSKNRFPALWKHAGCPTLLGDSDLISAWGTNRYLLRREYQSLRDEAGRQFAERLRLPMLIGYFGSWLAVVGFLVCLCIFGKPS
jgi:hypothetical protein